MKPVPNGVIIIWPSTHASIPSGFARETGLDNKHPKGATASGNIGNAGGSPTHTHTSPSHTHSLADHNHTYDLANIGSPGATSKSSGVNLWSIHGEHDHQGNSGSITGGDTSATAVTYGSVSNDPPFTAVIFIKSLGTAYMPIGTVVYTKEPTIPQGYQQADGTNGSLDLRNKYLKGAGTAADAGGTGGSTTNAHDISHTHTANTHSHSAVASNTPQGAWSQEDATGSSNPLVTKFHTHSPTWSAATQNINAFSGSLTTTETVEPQFKKLTPLHNLSSNRLYFGMVALWLGSVATIPSGWIWCDGNNGTPDLRGYFLKCANTTGEIGTTGGSNTHTHAAQAHSHTGNGTHTHTITGGLGHTNDATEPSSTAGIDVLNANAGGTTHLVDSISSVTVNYNNADTTADNANNEPEYKEVAFIMFAYDSSAAGAVLSLL